MSDTAATDVAYDLCLYWLRDNRDLALQRDDATADLMTARSGDTTLAAAVRPLLSGAEPAWDRARSMLEPFIADDLPARIALWCPAGADLPTEEPEVSEFAALVRQSALKLGPQERSYVPIPAKLYLRKNTDTGNVISVTGGLNPHWARFTDRVRGQYDLDSTQLHRLPESQEHLEALLDTIAERTTTMDVGQYAVIETIDAWTIQRLSGDNGVTIVGIPPTVAAEGALVVRRNLKRILVDSAAIRATDANLRALLVLAHYPRIEQETVTVALRGFDPTLYSGLDYVVLLADGVVKPLIQPAK
ncbi:MAG: hypothetical protein ABI559_00415 [Chloroflexota bacterium]